MSNLDLLIIGGGINGVAAALEAAKRGLAVALVEKNSLGSGTSSKTSKLAHGGLRYLAQFQFKVVAESLVERDLLLATYPDLVKPMPFVVPIYGQNPWPAWQLSVGLWVYDFLAKRHRLPRHERLRVSGLEGHFSGLKRDGLTDGFRYFDAQMDDLGLVRLLARQAEVLGVKIVENCCFKSLISRNNQVVGAVVEGLDGCLELEAKVVLQAMGPWSKGVLPSKGVHIVLPALPYSEALLLSAPQDGRVFFVIPWEGQTLVGTTETVYKGDPDLVRVEPEDVAYLIQAFNHYFPDCRVGVSDILSSFVGLRPLIDPGKSLLLGVVSRDFRLDGSVPGLLRVFGGKFTTHRAVAERVVDRVMILLAKSGRNS